jgi:hypothetical protein
LAGIADPRVARDRQGSGARRSSRTCRRPRRSPSSCRGTCGRTTRRGPARWTARRASPERTSPERLIGLVGPAGTDRLEARLGVGKVGEIGRRICTRPVDVGRQRARVGGSFRPRRVRCGPRSATAEHGGQSESSADSCLRRQRADESHGAAPYPNAAHDLPEARRLTPHASQPVRACALCLAAPRAPSLDCTARPGASDSSR